jgi:hypothetical protein
VIYESGGITVFNISNVLPIIIGSEYDNKLFLRTRAGLCFTEMIPFSDE